MSTKHGTHPDLLAVVSHDLRTPLNALLLAASVLAERANDNSELSREAGIIKHAANQTLRLVSDLLDASLLEDNRLRVFLQPCPVDELFRRAIDLLEEPAREKNVSLRFQMRENLAVFVDP